MSNARDYEQFSNLRGSTSDGSVIGTSEVITGVNTIFHSSLNNVAAAHVVMQTRRSATDQPWADTGYTMGASVECLLTMFAGREYRALIKKAPATGGAVSLTLSEIVIPDLTQNKTDLLLRHASDLPGGFPNAPGAIINSVIGDQSTVNNYNGLQLMLDSANAAVYYLVGADLNPTTGAAIPFHFVNGTGAKIGSLPPSTAIPPTNFLRTLTWSEAQLTNDPAFIVDEPDPDLADRYDGLHLFYKGGWHLLRYYDSMLTDSTGGDGDGGGTPPIPPPGANEFDIRFSTVQSGNFAVDVLMRGGSGSPTFYEADGTAINANFFSKNFGSDSSTKAIVLRTPRDGIVALPLAFKNITAFDIDANTGIEQLDLSGNAEVIVTDGMVNQMPGIKQLKINNTKSVITDAGIADKNLEALMIAATLSSVTDAGFAATTGLRILYISDSASTITRATINAHAATLEELQFNLKNLGLDDANLPLMPNLGQIHAQYTDTALTDANLERMPQLTELVLNGSASSIGGSGVAKLPLLHKIELNDCVDSSAAVDAIINQVSSNATTNAISGGTLLLQGSNPPRSANSDAGFDTLTGTLGWQVQVY